MSTARGSEDLVPREDGVHLWIAMIGTGPPAVLCHGGPGLWDDQEPVARMLDDALTVHRWDQRGAGRSSPSGPFTIATFVRDLEAIREFFGHETWVVVGHSWGASLALCYALEYPERVRALIYMCGTGLNWNHWRVAYHEEEHRRLPAEPRERYVALKSRIRTPEEEREFAILNRMPDYFDRPRARALAERDHDARFEVNFEANKLLGEELKSWDEGEMISRCHALRVPTLVVNGEGDPRPLDAVDSLVQALPDVRVEVIPRAGHEPWLENPEALRFVLRDFLGIAG